MNSTKTLLLDVMQTCISQALFLLGNACSHMTTCRQRLLLDKLHTDYSSLAKESFPECKDLFGPGLEEKVTKCAKTTCRWAVNLAMFQRNFSCSVLPKFKAELGRPIVFSEADSPTTAPLGGAADFTREGLPGGHQTSRASNFPRYVCKSRFIVKHKFNSFGRLVAKFSSPVAKPNFRPLGYCLGECPLYFSALQ